jgi:hypothetical protein
MGPWHLDAQRAPSPERQAEIVAMLAELALGTYQGNGRAPSPEVAWVCARIALGSPVTAARCPHVLAALGSDVRAAVLRLARATAVTDAAASVPPLASWLTVDQAAGLLGITAHGIRARCRRGQLAAVKHRVTSEWRIDPAAIEQNGSRE